MKINHETRSYSLAEVRFAKPSKTTARAKEDDESDDVEDEDDDLDERVVGYAVPFNGRSQDLGGYFEEIAPGAVIRSLTEAKAGTRNIVATWEHDLALPPVASTRSGMELTTDDNGLAFSFDPRRLTPAQADAIRSGDMQVSIGFFLRDWDAEERSDGALVRTVTDMDLVEFSFVLNPAYTQTEASMRAMETWKQSRAKPDTVKEELRARVNAAYLKSRLGPAK
jgi:uncharacterized protein